MRVTSHASSVLLEVHVIDKLTLFGGGLCFASDQVQDVEILPIIPCQPGDKVPDNLTRLMLEAVLHFSVSQVS